MSDKEPKPVQDDHDQSKCDNERKLGPEDVSNPQQVREISSGAISTTDPLSDQETPTPQAEASVGHVMQGEAQTSQKKDDLVEYRAEGSGKRHSEQQGPQSEMSVDPDTDEKHDVVRLTPQSEASADHGRHGEVQPNQKKDNLAENAAESGEKHHSDSPQSISPFAAESSSPLVGAVGGQAIGEQNGASPNNDEKFCRKCSDPDCRALYSGKEAVFNKFFGCKVGCRCVRSDHRTEHNADRQRSIPESNQGFSKKNPSGLLQTFDPRTGPVLNQAGAIVGVRLQKSKGHGQLVESGNNLAATGHSIGSSETVPIEDVYTGCFSPLVPCSDPSIKALSPGSISSSSPRAQSASDRYIRMLSPLPSSDSQDLENQPAAEALIVRRKRLLASSSTYIPTPAGGDSDLAGSEGSYSDDKGPASKHPKFSKSHQPSPADSDRNMHTDSPEPMSSLPSEEDTTSYSELAQSVESDDIQPIPDLVQDIPSHLMDEGTVSGSSHEQQPQEHGDVQRTGEDESKTEADPSSNNAEK